MINEFEKQKGMPGGKMDKPLSDSFACRKLAYDDLERVMNWRMSPHITRFMNTDPRLTLESQRGWFEKISADGRLCHWIVLVGDQPCGLINIDKPDLVNMRASWGYYIAETDMRSFALAVSLEMSLYDYAFDTLRINKMTAESLTINAAVIKIHELCGCKTEGTLRRHIKKNDLYYDVRVQSMLADEWRALRDSQNYQRIVFP